MPNKPLIYSSSTKKAAVRRLWQTHNQRVGPKPYPLLSLDESASPPDRDEVMPGARNTRDHPLQVAPDLAGPGGGGAGIPEGA